MFRFTLLFLSLLAISLQAQTQEEFYLPRLTGPIILDGLSDEPAWQAIEPLPLTMHTPTFSGSPTVRTEIRVAYDDDYLYLSGRMYEADPGAIQANSLVRDVDRGGDFLNLLLDTFNDNENLTAFVTTPAGNRLDAEITNDAEGADFFNQDWNGFWHNAVVQNEEGWFVEMRIPFSSLRFQNRDGQVVFGMIVHRRVGRNNERLTFPAIPPNWAEAPWKASQAQDVILEGVVSRRPLYLTPYLLGGIERTNGIVPNTTRTTSNHDLDGEAGFDLKYGLSNNMTMDLTLNTDFAQVEADAEQVNLTRFSLFFPEKRQFFQERSGIFSFRFSGDDRLFYSRRIGLTDDGDPVRIWGGARLAGRLGAWDLGALNMQTASSPQLPAENFGVLRLRRRILNSFSYLGGMLTSRIGDNGAYNINYGLDSILRLFGDDYLTVNWAQTFENRSANMADASLARLEWTRRSTQGLGFLAELMHTGRDFEPGVGFITRSDILQLQGKVSYGWFLPAGSALRKHSPSISTFAVWRKSDQALESSLLTLAWDLEMKSGASAMFSVQREYEDLLMPFELGDGVAVRVGNYTFYTMRAFYAVSEGRPLRTSVNLEVGSFYDGNRVSFVISPIWNHSRHFEISGDYEFNRLRFPERGQKLNANIARLRLLYALNRHLSANALIQYNSVDERLGLNVRVRYDFSEGHDLYIVYNEALNVDRNLGAPQLPASESRSLQVKYVYTFLR